MIRTAFVLGAGLGTRLKSLTARRPKPLIPIANRPLITYAFDHLLDIGVQRFVVNTHHCAEAYPAAFPDSVYRGAPLHFCHEHPEVLETAGGIRNARELIGEEPFVVYNGDILSDLPLEPALRAHREQQNEVTLVLRSKDGPLQVACDTSSGRITGIGGKLNAAEEPRFLFTGIYLVNPEFFARIPPAQKISVIPIFLEMIRTAARLGGVVIDEGHWWDLGSREQVLRVHRALATSERPHWIDPSALIAPSAAISGATAIGARARVGAGVKLHDCIVWEGAEIADESSLDECIVTADARVSGMHAHADL